jgi:hypothetical protein
VGINRFVLSIRSALVGINHFVLSIRSAPICIAGWRSIQHSQVAPLASLLITLGVRELPPKKQDPHEPVDGFLNSYNFETLFEHRRRRVVFSTQLGIMFTMSIATELLPYHP